MTIGLEVSLEEKVGNYMREMGAEIGVGFGLPTPNDNSRSAQSLALWCRSV